MRARAATLVLVVVFAGCTRLPRPENAANVSPFSVRHLPPSASPSPLDLEVRSGQVLGLVPDSWEVRPLPQGGYPTEGFVASPRIEDWNRNAGSVRGMEAFWVDVAKVGLPSDFYYLIARGPAMGSLAANKSCRPLRRHVVVNHRPDYTGETFSRSDYVASTTGVCGSARTQTRWEYVVVAPGMGPLRRTGIAGSGLYVVMAAVSGPDSDTLLRRMIDATRFSNTSISQIANAEHLTQ